MNPASAMGTFLRVWRSEWAGLSRAQLAIAISTQLPKRKAVTIKAIRRWEEGHPPHSTEELEALCKTMRRHALSQPEVEQVRQTVFAACVGRQYPALFEAGDFARRDDVDAVARTMWSDACGWTPAKGLVTVIACLQALHEAVMRRGDAGPTGQRRRQWVALALLQNTLATIHRCSGRCALARRMYEANNGLLMEQLGGSLGSPITVEYNRAQQLAMLGYERWLRHEPFDRVAREMVASYRELATEAGPGRRGSDRQLASCWLTTTVDLLTSGGRPEYVAVVHSLEPEHFALCDAMGVRDLVSYIHGGAAYQDGRWADAERHLAAFDHWRDGGDPERYRWECFGGTFALARGDYAEALEHLPRAQLLANQLGDHILEAMLGKRIEECEAALQVRSRTKAQTTPARPKNGGNANPAPGSRKVAR